MNKNTRQFVKVMGLAAAVIIAMPAEARFFANSARMQTADGTDDNAFASRPRRGGDPMAIFDRIDSDQDGFLSLEEVLNARSGRSERRFDQTDEDGDGLISLEEFLARSEKHHERFDGQNEEVIACVEAATGKDLPDVGTAPTAEERFAELDTNSDGVLDTDELAAVVTEKVTEKFNEQDADGDGFLSSDEFLATADTRAAFREAVKSCKDQVSADSEMLDGLAADSLKQVGF